MRPLVKQRLQIALIGAAWCVLSGVCFLRWNAPVKGWIFGALGGIFLLSGLVIPPFARAIHMFLTVVTNVIVAVLSWVLLGLSYYLLVTPLGFFLRLAGSVQTTRDARLSRASYWVDRPRTPMNIARYLRPF